jgi:hypothetical protein
VVRILVAVVLAGHGLIHLMGVVSLWRLATIEQVPYGTTILSGAIDIGDGGVRVVGLVWALAAALFVVSAWTVWRGSRSALGIVTVSAVVSLIVCIVGLPGSEVGVLVNVVILAAVVVRTRIGPSTPLVYR